MKRIQEKLLSRFDKNRLFFVSRLTILFLFLVIAINLLGTSYSKYEAETPATGEAQVAYFIVRPGERIQSLTMDKLVPSNTPNTYYIDIFNYEYDDIGTKIITNVNLSYAIAFEMTTNLPLNIEIYKDGGTTNLAQTPIIYQDKDCVYYKRYVVPNKYSFSYGTEDSDRYTIKVTFPLSYKNSPEAYSGAIDLLTVLLNAEQTTSRTILNVSDYQNPTDYSDVCNIEESEE